MRHQPNRNYVSEDRVMTPPGLARAIIEHFKPSGRMLEPCRGAGAFLKAMKGADWCEIERGRNFFDYKKNVDWIVTNPPWSLLRAFLKKAMEVSDNVVFLCTVNHFWTKARVADIKEAGFYTAEIALIDPYPNPEFPASGFQLGAIHLKRGRTTKAKLSKIIWRSLPDTRRTIEVEAYTGEKDEDEVSLNKPLIQGVMRVFAPKGRVATAVTGKGAFRKLMLDKGKKDWIVACPPWSKIRVFLQKSMSSAKNVVILCTVNHLWTRARVRDIEDAGFIVAEIMSISPYPKTTFPPCGFQFGAIRLARGKMPNSVKLSRLEWE